MKKLIYCTNVHSDRDEVHLQANIYHLKDICGDLPIFVASNGIDKLSKEHPNVTFKKFGVYNSYQIGPPNSLLNSLRMAAEAIPDIENYDVVFSHADLYIYNLSKLTFYLNSLSGDYDMVVRNYVGPGGNRIPGRNYYMSEDILISGRVMSRFKELDYDYFKFPEQLINGVHEISFADLIDNKFKFNVNRLDFVKQTERVDNEMGFYHNHVHCNPSPEETSQWLKNVAFLTHTHSECFDVLNVFLSKLKKYYYDFYNLSTNHYLLLDKPSNTEYNVKELFYNESDIFSKRILKALDMIPEEFIIFNFEDYIPYDYVDFSLLKFFVDTMESDPRVSFIRLLQSGVVKDGEYGNQLFIMDKNHPYYFSTQTTIWRKSVLKALFESCDMLRPQNEIDCSVRLGEVATLGLCVNGRGNQVGGHYDSLVFPYTAVAILGKKWNVSEYPVLNEWFKEFSIDPSIRGTR